MLAALARLAAHVVGELPGLTVVGVTGSSGKTSTKDLLAAVLAPLGPTVAPPESFNNELGLPWTALRADAGTRHLVLEFSARGTGHIAALAAGGAAADRRGAQRRLARTSASSARSTAIARAKGELVEALPAARGRGAQRRRPARRRHGRAAPPPGCVTFGARADVRAEDLTLDAGRARFRLVTPAGSAPVALRLVGAHHVGNALAAAAVAGELGGAPETVAAALSAAAPASRWRMEVTDRADGVTVVNDAYNANPDSMAAALRALAAVGGGRRTWAVLGPMRELGARERGRARRASRCWRRSWASTSSSRSTARSTGQAARWPTPRRPPRCWPPSWRRATSCW